MHSICVNTEWAKIFFNIFLSLDAFSGPEYGDKERWLEKWDQEKNQS